MKLFYILLLLLSSKVFSKSIECNNPKKLWGMNNEINGITVSSVDIYMCFNDPLNIYNSNDNSNDNSNLKISNENLNILSYNNSIQKIINQSKLFYNDSYNLSNISIFNPTTTTSTPTTTTSAPTTTTSAPTTTTSAPTTTTTTTTPTTTTSKPTTTTTSTPTTTTSAPTTTTSITTTTLFPITTTSLTTTSNINLTNNTLEKTNFNLRGSSKSLDSNNEQQQQHDIPLIIFITVLSSFACCISVGGLIYYKLKSKIKPSFVVEQKKIANPNNINKINVKPNKPLHKNNVNNIINNIQTEKKALIKLQNNIGKQSKIQESIKNMKPEIKRKKSLTPKSKAIRGLVSHNSWYQDTFKDELNILKDSNNTPPPPPPSNNNDIPKLPIPKLQNKTQKNNVNMKISKKKNNIHPNIQQQYEKFNRQYNGKVRNKYN